MDVCESKRGTLQKKQSTVGSPRLPLAPAIGGSRIREVSSRYRSPSPSVSSSGRRCPSPNVTRTSPLSTVSVPKRAISAERNRPTTPLKPSRPASPSTRSPSTPVHGSAAEALLATKKLPEGLWPSTMRSLSVSFQSDTFSFPVSKREKPPPQAITDRPLRLSANITLKQGESTPGSQKATPERKRSPLKGKSLVDQSENSRPPNSLNARLVTRAGGKLSSTPLTRSIDLSDKTSRPSSTPLGRGMPSIRRLSLDGPRLPLRGASGGRSLDDNSCPQTPNKVSILSSLLSRGVSPSRIKPTSPSRVRPPSPSRQSTSTTSVLSFVVDIKKGKGANHIEDAHQLRLLYNRHLQWRFANARARAVLQSQKLKAEKILYNVWRTVSNMWDSLSAKRIELRQLRLKLKLYSVLSEQLAYLDEWALIESDHMTSLSLATQDLKDCTLRLPIACGATGDTESLKSAICSAVDIMQAMASSICSLLSPAEEVNCVISGLADVAAQQRAVLDECEALLASTAALQVEEYSLRTNLIQLRQSLQLS